MNPNDDFLNNFPKEHSGKFLKTLYSLYAESNDGIASLDKFRFSTFNLLNDDDIKKQLPTIKALSNQFKDYSENQILNVVLNSLSNSNLMFRGEQRFFYLTENGYKIGMKNTNIIKYWSSYHSNTFYTSLCTVVLIIVTIICA